MTTETITMRERIKQAADLPALDALYVDFVGYSVVQDDPTSTVDSVRDALVEWVDELYASDTPRVLDALNAAAAMMEVGQEPTSALKQAGSDIGIPYNERMAEFVGWGMRQLGN